MSEHPNSPWNLTCLLTLSFLIILASCTGGTNVAGGSNTGGSGSGGSTGSGSGGSGGSGSGGSGSSGGTGSSSSSCQQMSLGANASLGGFVPFSSSSLWNTDISAAAADPNSASIISNYIGSSTNVHPDFGTDPTYGIPFIVVDGSQNLVAVNLGAYGGESDPGPMPIPSNAPIEGGSSSTGDRHVLVLDKDNCFLYELFNSSPNSNGSWSADSTAVWDLLGNEQRPYGWTSADAAGLPIFPGLVRYDEAAAGNIQHAFRFTVPHTRAAFTPPASHWAGNTSDPNAPPMGMRLRLKASYDISGFSTQMQAILAAMKKYGLILADNGSALYVTGASDARWGSDLDTLKNVPATAFEVVTISPIYTSSNLPTGAAPTISSFAASPTSASAGSSVTLSWSVSNATYLLISPGAGAVRGTSVVVKPSATTTYTLYATNQYDRSTATVTVTVP
jgi:hypothetical protein